MREIKFRGKRVNGGEWVKSMTISYGTIKRKMSKTVQRELFPDLSEEEERIVKRLGKMPEGLQINTLVIDTNIPVNRMSALLFELEMKGVIRALAGGVYRLIM